MGVTQTAWGLPISSAPGVLGIVERLLLAAATAIACMECGQLFDHEVHATAYDALQRFCNVHFLPAHIERAELRVEPGMAKKVAQQVGSLEAMDALVAQVDLQPHAVHALITPRAEEIQFFEL